MSKKTVIIGGVAGGATAAARLRRRDEGMEIVILEKGDYISFANCGLPYYVGDVIKSRDALLLQTPEAMKKKFGIDVRIASEVTAIHPQKKSVTVQRVKTGETYEESYDSLIIATGSSPLKPGIPGINGDNVFTLWNIPDTDRIKKFMQEKKPKSAAVIGGGFIGIEMAENLLRAGLQVSVIEMQDQVMAPVDFEMAQLLHENIQENGVRLFLGDGVDRFSHDGGTTEIHLKSGAKAEADMVILSIGVRPNSALAGAAGIALNSRGGIVVNEYLETTEKDIYAVGDVTEVHHFVSGQKVMIPLAGPANKQARICADNIAGDRKIYEGTLGTSVAQAFDLSVAATGLNEKTLNAQGKVKGRDYEAVLINQKSHAGYYPGASQVTLKLIFDREKKILGAQIVGQENVDKRIDTIASVMRLNGTTEDLAKLELSYAPPFSSAKDPVNMLGFVAENVLKGLVSFISVQKLDEMTAEKNSGLVILDITEEAERMVFSIPGSVHIPLGELRGRLSELDRESLVVVYCAVGVRSYNAARILMQNGFSKVKVLEGGTSFYKSYHYQPEESRGKADCGNQGIREEETNVKAAALEEDVLCGAINQEVKILDCCGLQCPGPIMKVNETLKTMRQGESVRITATDMGFARDIKAWCERTGNTLVSAGREGKENVVTVKKGSCAKDDAALETKGLKSCEGAGNIELPQGKTLVVFDGDLDKVLAAFIIANGAAAMGRPVTMFFTFWGLNALRKTEKVKVKKTFIEKMFGWMMPRGTGRLKLSKMNMGGMGTKMMKRVMKDKNVSSLEELMEQAMAQGIKLVACTMSMDVMGISREELIDGVEYAGVASYLGDAESSNVNLFV